MTRARVSAQQTVRPPKGMRMLRGTVSAVSPLTVQIAGGGAVTGLAVPGQTYTVGDLVLVTVQEPAVGPVYPLTPTAPPDLTPYAKTTDLAAYAKTTDLTAYAKTSTGTLTYSGTVADYATSRKSSITKVGPIATLQLQATVGATPPAAGAVLATLPTGFRPSGGYANFRVEVYSNAWANITASIEAESDGRLVLVSTTSALAAGYGLFGLATFPAA